MGNDKIKSKNSTKRDKSRIYTFKERNMKSSN